MSELRGQPMLTISMLIRVLWPWAGGCQCQGAPVLSASSRAGVSQGRLKVPVGHLFYLQSLALSTDWRSMFLTHLA